MPLERMRCSNMSWERERHTERQRERGKEREKKIGGKVREGRREVRIKGSDVHGSIELKNEILRRGGGGSGEKSP